MHMSDALLSPAVGGAMWAGAVGCIAVAVRASRKNEALDALEARKAPLMGVMGAFVFAAQMINFTIPGTGSSGHLCGALLLCAIVGAPAALLTMATILTIQALLFADGGLLALGANILNMGAATCFVAYPLLFRPMLRGKASPARIAIASMLTAIAGLQLGSFALVLETQLSGKTALPFGPFALLMQSIHLAIGIGEGLVTTALLLFLLQASPETVTDLRQSGEVPRKIIPTKIVALIAVAALAVAGALSWFASTLPDGLEWSVERTAGSEPQASSEVHQTLDALQKDTALLPDYSLPSQAEEAPANTVDARKSAAGLIGAGTTLLIVAIIGAALYLPKRKRKRA